MELTGIDSTRIIYLIEVRRPSGQLYLPDAIAKVGERYSFLKLPNPEQPLPYTFGIGKFGNSQIAELSLYNDGLIITSASDSDLLEAFLQDLLAWATKEFGLVQVAGATPQKFYESSIIVRSSVDLTASLRPQINIVDVTADALKNADVESRLSFSGAIFDFDQAEIKRKRKPFRLIIDRRINLPFSENIFFSQAPFRTKDHLTVIERIEKLSIQGRN